MITLENAKEYFRNHLLGEFFLESKEEQMTAALTMAENDVRCQLNGKADETDPCYLPAVCEQAVFLLTHQERLTDDRVLISETVDGLGSRSYAVPGSDVPLRISPRAELYIQNMGQVNLIRLARG